MEIICEDGRSLAATFYPRQTEQRRGVLVVNSATGVVQQYCRHFANYFAGRGFDVLTWDGRGIGASRQGHPAKDKARMRDWGQLDLEAVLHHVVALPGVSWEDLTVIGHSSGGHLSALAPALQKVPRLILVAAGTGNWRKYPKGQWLRTLSAWYLLVPLLAGVLGYVPGRLGVGHDLPHGVAKDWRHWCVADDYLFSDATLDSSGYQHYAGDLLALAFTDDHGYAPLAVVQDLLDHFPAARQSLMTIHPPDTGRAHIGHFGYFKAANQDLWPRIENWLAERA